MGDIKIEFSIKCSENSGHILNVEKNHCDFDRENRKIVYFLLFPYFELSMLNTSTSTSTYYVVI